MIENKIFHVKASQFMESLHEKVLRVPVDVSNCFVDHVCFRVATEESYKLRKLELECIGTLLTEVEINSRLIATFKLDTPIDVNFQKQPVSIVELPAPKLGTHHPDGFEHMEYVLPVSFEEFQERNAILKNLGKMKVKKINSELELAFGSAAVKFHLQSLESIIALET